MAFARLLRPSLPLIATCALTTGPFTRHSQHRVRLDSSATAAWPRDPHLVAEGRKELQRESKQHPSSRKKGDAPLVDKGDPPDSYTPGFEDEDAHAWARFSNSFNGVIDASKDAITKIEWSYLGDQIRDFVAPAWLRSMPELVQKLQNELSMKPGSLADEMWQEAHDPQINPEILWDARVRVSQSLCPEEIDFRRARKERIVKALAKYLDLPESNIDPEDVPTIAICGSGGGLRAMIAGSSSYLCAQQAGLYDCVTYTAGVSGSCWLQSLYFSSLGKQNFEHLIEHLKNRTGTHIAFPPTALKLVTSAPTNKFLLSGWVEKAKGDPSGTYGLVDIYSLLLAARYMIPKGDLDVQDRDLKLSNQRNYLDGDYAGLHPMPIYTAVRHEIPVLEAAATSEQEGTPIKDQIKEKAKQEAWFSWFEMSPFEVFCEDFGAGIPTWSLGRLFRNGRNVLLDTGIALPEMRQSLLLGIWGSAFCATLSHYRHELQLAGLVGWGQVDQMLEEKNEELIRIHPIEPASIPNFVSGMKGQLPDSCPESVFKSDHIQLMDAGMSNNLPIYPLLRPGREVDILVAFDASAEIQKENWLSVVDGYAKQRGIQSWPVGTGFAKQPAKPEEIAEVIDEANRTTRHEATVKIEEAKEESGKPESKPEDQTAQATPLGNSLGSCTVWVGTKQERTTTVEPPPSPKVSWDDPEDSTFQLMRPNAGLAVVYFPLLPNSKVEGIDPDKTDFLSTWNFVYTPEQIDKVVALAKANFEEGADQTKRTVRAVYERKKKARLEREEKSLIKKWKTHLRDHGDPFK